MWRHQTLGLTKFVQGVGFADLELYATSVGCPRPDGIGDEQIQGWLESFDDATRAQVMEDWKTINDVCDEAADYLDLAYRRSTLTLDDDAPRERLGMRLFLGDRPAFDMAADLYLWRDASLKMSHYRLAPDVRANGLPDTTVFQAAISKHFQETMRSDRCIARSYDEAGVWIVVVAHGDYPHTQQRWHDDGPRPDFFRPARQDVLQYNPVSGVLSLRIDGRPSRDDQQLYVSAFSEHCLGVAPPVLEELDTTISLECIRQGEFSYDGNEQIEWVRLAAADLRFSGGTTAAVIRSGDVRAALRGCFRGTRLADADLNSVKLHMKVRGQRGRPRAVSLKPPSRSEISRDAAVIEEYLRQQGVLLA